MQVQIERVWAHYWLGQPDAMRGLIERVEPAVRERGSAAQRARFYQAVAHHGLKRGRYRIDAPTLDAAERSLAAAAEAGDLTNLAFARFMYGMVFLFEGRVAEAEERLREAYDDTSLTGDLVMRLRCLTYLTVARRLAGDPDEADALAAEALALATRLRMDDYVGAARACMAWAAWRRGDRERAEAETGRALGAWAALNARYAYPLAWLALLLELERLRGIGDVKAAVAAAAAMLDGTQARLPEALEAALRRCLDAGDEGAALEALDISLSTARAAGYL